MAESPQGIGELAGKRILLTGSSGQVGGDLLDLLRPGNQVTAPMRGEVDLADVAGDFKTLRELIRSTKPEWILNPAAYTAVDKAESDPEVAFSINRDAVRVMGEEAQRIGARVIHFSTDYVFAGVGTTPYVETDETGPVSIYGASKLAGELALAESGAAHWIFRTSWVYGGRGKNFLLTILKAARERELLRIVGDQHGAPTWSKDLARMTVTAMRRIGATDNAKELTGVYHATGGGETTWCGFAAEALRLMQAKEPETKFANIEAIPTAEYPTPAKRPANSRLNCGKLAERLEGKMMDWKSALSDVVASL